MASLHFYRYFLKQNGENTNYNLVKIIDHIYKLSFPLKYIKIKNNWYALNGYKIPKNNKSMRFFQIDKSINNVYTGELGTNLKQVHVPLYSRASFLLIPFYHLIIAYQPQNSPSISKVSKYFMSYIKTKYNYNDFYLDISSIVYNLALCKITPEYKIKDIHVLLNLGNANHSNKVEKLLKMFTHISPLINDKPYMISFKFKNSLRSKFVNYALVNNLIKQIHDSHSDIVKVSFRIKAPYDYRFKDVKIDNKSKSNSNILLPFNVGVSNPSSQYLCDKMLYYYENKKIPKEINYFENDDLLKIINPFNVHLINNPKNDYYNLKNTIN